MNKNNINNNDKEQYDIITVVPTEVVHSQTTAISCYKSNNNTRFVKPTVEEISNYIVEKGYFDVDAQTFWDFYESKNWMVGRNKMHKWKSAVATWHHKASSNNYNSRNYGGGNTYVNSETMAILERAYNMF